jgi:hypothetical protein
MCSEQDHELLTAYVDGELGARQTRQALKLLHRSREARALYQALKTDARALRDLTHVRPDAGLADAVLQNIWARGLRPGRQTVPPHRASVPHWSGYVAAAAVLVVVCGASYFYFADALDQQTCSIMNLPTGVGTTPRTTPAEPILPPERNTAANPREELPIPPKPEQPIVQAPPVDFPTPPQPDPAADKPKDPTFLTAPATDMVELKIADIAAPVLVKLRDLDQRKAKGELVAELNKATGFRVEFPCRNGTRAYERLTAAAKGCDLVLNVDKEAVERLKHPQLRTNYAIYVEDVTPEELAHFLELVAAEDKKTDPK